MIQYIAKWIVISLCVIALAACQSDASLMVEDNQRAVITNQLTDTITVLDPGTYTLDSNDEATVYQVSEQSYRMVNDDSEDTMGAIEARTEDGEQVTISIDIRYQLDPQQLELVHQNWGARDITTQLIRPLVRAFVRDTLSRTEVATLLEGFESEMPHQDLANILQTEITPTFEEEGLILLDVIILDIRLSDVFQETLDTRATDEAQSP